MVLSSAEQFLRSARFPEHLCRHSQDYDHLSYSFGGLHYRGRCPCYRQRLLLGITLTNKRCLDCGNELFVMTAAARSHRISPLHYVQIAGFC